MEYGKTKKSLGVLALIMSVMNIFNSLTLVNPNLGIEIKAFIFLITLLSSIILFIGYGVFSLFSNSSGVTPKEWVLIVLISPFSIFIFGFFAGIMAS